MSNGKLPASEIARAELIVQDSEEREIAVVVLRRGAVRNIMVTPKRWHGRGLLGASLNSI